MKHFLTLSAKIKIIFLISALEFLLLPSVSLANTLYCINETVKYPALNYGRSPNTCYSNIPDQKTAEHLKNLLIAGNDKEKCHITCWVDDLNHPVCTPGEYGLIVPYDPSKPDTFYQACANTNLDCATDADCLFEGITGLCKNNYCAYTPTNINIMRDKLTSIPCGKERCNKIDEKCAFDGNCDQFGGGPQVGAGRCFLGSCYLDQVRESKYKNQPTLLGVQADLKIQKPLLEIRIPGLKFSDVKNTIDSEGYLHLPYLGEFLTLVYRLAMVVASILAAVMLIVNGARIIISAGGEEKQAAIKHIGSAVIGLVILWGSYAIMYNINPDLVNFKVLKVKYIENVPMPEEDDNIEPENFPPSPAGTKVEKPNWTAATFDCAKKDSYAPTGVAPEADVINVACPGLRGSVKLLPAVKDPLCKAAAAAAKDGYSLAVGPMGSYRPFKDQADGWCGPGAKDYHDPIKRKSFRAVPGFSNHGLGQAIDIILMKDNKTLYSAKASAQCKVPLDVIERIANYMYKADPNFVRYDKEIWHFEYGSTQPLRSKTTGYPPGC